MTALELRNTVVKGLTAYLGCPVILSDQVQPEPVNPFVSYTVTAPYISKTNLGDHSQVAAEDAGGAQVILDTRKEHAEATYSFTACSANREENGVSILGDDEAQAIAEKASGWFLQVGYDELSLRGIVVVEVMNSGNRTGLEVDEAARRYGFDVRLRYARTDTRRDGIVADYNVRSEKRV